MLPKKKKHKREGKGGEIEPQKGRKWEKRHVRATESTCQKTLEDLHRFISVSPPPP